MPCDIRSPRLARRFCAATVGSVLSAGPEFQTVLDDVVIVASELVTNSVKANCTELELTLSIHRDHLLLVVGDDAPGKPRLMAAGPEDVGGRGVAIMAALAQAWGVWQFPAKKQVWAELAFPPQLAANLTCSGGFRTVRL
ncbi:MAG: ATP-binding protein [Pseudonocardiales bacterium]